MSREIILGDPYWTDGRRAVMLFPGEPVAMDEIEFLLWDSRSKEMKEIVERVQQESTSKSE